MCIAPPLMPFLAAVLCSAADVSTAVPAAKARVVSIADLHGDFDHAVTLLRAAGLVEVVAKEESTSKRAQHASPPFSRYTGVRWTGGNATLVQTGDLVDRGAYARDLYALFADLRDQAILEGGRVINLLGNHELMNLIGDLRYVSREDTAEFGGGATRRAHFSLSGDLGRELLEEYQLAAVVGDTLFVHAGILPEHIADGIDALNALGREQLQRAASGGRSGRGEALLQATGPLWLRRFATGPETKICPQLKETLRQAGAKRMVVGHTQVEEGRVRPRCGGRLLMADTIISMNGYPMCWQTNSMEHAGCEGSMSYVELRDGDAYAIRLAKSGHQAEHIPVVDDGGEL